MSDNICSTCYKKFISPSHLKRHNNSKNGCKRPEVDIMASEYKYDDSESFMTAFRKIIKDTNLMTIDNIKLALALLEDECNARLEQDLLDKKIYKCIDCNDEFAFRQGLHRHQKDNRCRAKKQGYGLDDIMQSAPSVEHIAINKPDVNIYDNENSNITVDASIKNYVTNNYNINFSIQPFGLESLGHITLKDFKYIFADSSKLMNKLCNYVFLQNLSNISFYKHNLNKQIISFLSKNMEIEKIDEKGFIMQFTRLLEDTCILLFYQHKEQLTEQELIKYMKRLVEYQDTILYERNGIVQTDTKNCILNLMDTAFRNKDIKYNIEKIIKDLNENLIAKNDIVDRLIDENYKRDDIINEFYDKPSLTRSKTESDNQTNPNPNKLLHKIRKKAIEQNKEDAKASRKRAIENSLKDVKFSTADNDC